MSVEGFNLDGKRALVVGDDRPVGQAIAAALAEAGARVASVAGKFPERAVGPIRLSDGSAAPSEFDAALTEPGQTRQLVARIAQLLGGLEIVVACMGRPAAGPLNELSDDHLDRLVQVNLTIPTRLLREAGRHLTAQGGGRLIVVHSMLADRGQSNAAAYTACQAGLAQLVRTLALEWARQDVRVNGIALGWFEDDPLALAADGDRLARYLPARRLGRPDEAGALAVYLASDASDMTTGHSFVLDGGALVHA